MERNIRNAAEFLLFEGRCVRVWDNEVTDWVSGRIAGSDPEALMLEIAHEGDSSASAELRRIPYVRISKAKLLQM